MLKKKWVVAIGALLLVVVFFVASGCNAVIEQVDPDCFLTEKDLTFDASFSDQQGNKKSKFDFTAAQPEYFDIQWETSRTFNTLVLREGGENVAEFELYARGDTQDRLIYRQDKIEGLRYCCFERVTTNRLRIKITKLKNSDASFRLTSAKVYDVQNGQNDFRATSYVVFDRILEYGKIDIQSFLPVTDVILFGAVRFETDGSIVYEKEGYEQKFLTAINNLQRIQADLKKTFRIYVNILNPNVDDVTVQNQSQQRNARSQTAMGKNRSMFIKNIKAFLDKYSSRGLSGVAFDWEFPDTNAQWSTYSDFLVELKEKTNTNIAVAVPPWGVKFSAKAKEAIDVVELMAYDLPDENGYHSNFYDQAVMAVQYLIKNGFAKEKIDLGIPFYARPTDMAALWFEYALEADKLGKYSNVASGNLTYETGGQKYVCTTPRYYNGYTMVYDKTRYARDMRLGGIMVWNHTCDTAFEKENSLWRAVYEAIKA